MSRVSRLFDQSSSQLFVSAAIWLAVLIMSILVQYLGLTQPIARSLQLITQPAREIGAEIANQLISPARAVVRSGSSAQLLRDLEYQYAQQQARLAELEGIEAENRELRRMLENTDRRYQQSVVTTPITAYATALIAAGTEQGLVAGNPILVDQTVVGRVSEPGATQSRVTLLSQSESEPLIVRTQRGVSGIVTGNGRDVILQEVASDAELETGDRVVTVGQPGVPADLFVGTVQDVESEPAAAVQRVRLLQPASLYEARVVEVVQ